MGVQYSHTLLLARLVNCRTAVYISLTRSPSYPHPLCCCSGPKYSSNSTAAVQHYSVGTWEHIVWFDLNSVMSHPLCSQHTSTDTVLFAQRSYNEYSRVISLGCLRYNKGMTLVQQFSLGAR